MAEEKPDYAIVYYDNLGQYRLKMQPGGCQFLSSSKEGLDAIHAALSAYLKKGASKQLVRVTEERDKLKEELVRLRRVSCQRCGGTGIVYDATLNAQKNCGLHQ